MAHPTYIWTLTFDGLGTASSTEPCHITERLKQELVDDTLVFVVLHYTLVPFSN